MLSWSSFPTIFLPSHWLLSFISHNHCRYNEQQWESNESYHQSSDGILAEPWIKPATSCSQVLHSIDWTGLNCVRKRLTLLSKEEEIINKEDKSILFIYLFPECMYALWKGESHALCKNYLPVPVLTLFPNKPCFVRVCCKNLFKTMWEKEKLRVTSNFSFSLSVFYPVDNFLPF